MPFYKPQPHLLWRAVQLVLKNGSTVNCACGHRPGYVMATGIAIANRAGFWFDRPRFSGQSSPAKRSRPIGSYPERRMA
jgi:hypothetical protein